MLRFLWFNNIYKEHSNVVEYQFCRLLSLDSLQTCNIYFCYPTSSKAVKSARTRNSFIRYKIRSMWTILWEVRSGPIKEIRRPGANVCFGAPIFSKLNVGEAKEDGENFFPDSKKRSKNFSSRTSATTKGAVIINAGGGAGRYWGGGGHQKFINHLGGATESIKGRGAPKIMYNNHKT
jgi:hypothetical protein